MVERIRKKTLKIFVVQILDICIGTHPLGNNKDANYKMPLKIHPFNASFEPAKQNKQTNPKSQTKVQLL